ncbi:ATP-binding protein [Niabella soli]|uniref:Adenylate kinase n=1 Tax=Niabella soli DSM 19437 TaxID=929713 RepID=W0F808_9BACT|nr:ATP-binding protein [Niabella soli]AHF17948.1 hypothetical protein NIASO_17440 [Niabella soli DSM 19437]
MSKIIFIGGIHGTGKSTISQMICAEFDFEYLLASSLLKWAEINTDPKNKKVKDVTDTQDRLILGLNDKIQKDVTYLLDGHFCLLNNSGKIMQVPILTFQTINPAVLIVVHDKIDKIKLRLEKRDGRLYDADLLHTMQEAEITHATNLSQELKIPLIKTDDAFVIINKLQEIFKP